MASATKNMYKQCETCKKSLQSFCISTQFANCCNHNHANCVNMKREETENNEMWYCSYCLQSIFPFNHMDDDEDFNSAILEGLKGVWTKNCNQLSFLHLNVKSIPKHSDELEMYINSLKLEFTMIALTETWLDRSKQDLYNMPKYNCINRFRKQRRDGGVSLYIKYDIKFMNRPE